MDVVNMVKCVKQNSEHYALISGVSAIDSLAFCDSLKITTQKNHSFRNQTNLNSLAEKSKITYSLSRY